MNTFNKQKHWEKIYSFKGFEEMSWFQPEPAYSLKFMESLNLPKTAKIIDIGGGDSYFVDHLLEMDFQDITVLDISATAIRRAKNRLGEKAHKVNWIVKDIAEYHPNESYDFWHDRAVFHFLTSDEDIHKYIKTLQKATATDGHILIGTFSMNGPKQCSGLQIKQYSERSMIEQLGNSFKMISCSLVDHTTPSGSIQNFIFCGFVKS